MVVLAQDTWRARQAAHEQRVDELVGDDLSRRRQRQKDPVADFLFEYYGFRATRLRRWSPGIGVVLEGPQARELAERRHFTVTPRGVTLTLADVPARRFRSLKWMRDLLVATRDRQPWWGCHGMHEWAMVYRRDRTRHRQPLRMSPDVLAALVESRPIRCTHYDAFRFFSEPARPLNQLQPTPETMQELEQPGCLHTNMDVYRWAFKADPFVPSELVADAFEVAREARTVDMRASPYDLTSQGLLPIPIETPQGRVEYRREQERIAALAQPVRARLIQAYDTVLDAADQHHRCSAEPV